jgi:ornithine cyclodeaminase
MTRLLTRTDLEQLLDVERVMDTCAAAFAAYSNGQTVTPLRLGVEPPGMEGTLLAMPCAVANPPALGTKVVTVFRQNPARGVPVLASLYLLSDYETGVPLSVMDGAYLTGLRTAAASAVATRLLARPDARTLGVFGTGVQARFHVQTIRRARPIGQVLVAGTSPEKAERFANWIQEVTGLAARPAPVEEVSAADLVATCTTSPTPVVDAERVRPGAHINAVGAFTPTTRELPTTLMTRARVYVDTRAGACAEAGDLLIPVHEGALALDTIVGELGEVLLDRAPARQADTDITVYKSVGAAFLDAATARLAYEQALAAGVGVRFTFA